MVSIQMQSINKGEADHSAGDFRPHRSLIYKDYQKTKIASLGFI